MGWGPPKLHLRTGVAPESGAVLTADDEAWSKQAARIQKLADSEDDSLSAGKPHGGPAGLDEAASTFPTRGNPLSQVPEERVQMDSDCRARDHWVTKLLQQDDVSQKEAFGRHPRDRQKWAYCGEDHLVSEGPGPRHAGWRDPDRSEQTDNMPVMVGSMTLIPGEDT